jgi:hypothetical protein
MTLHGLCYLETSLHQVREGRFLKCPEVRLLVLRSIPLLKSSIKQHRPTRFFGKPRIQKMHGLSTTWNNTSTSPNSFLRRPECRLWILRPIRLHNTSLKGLYPSPFFDVQEPQNEFAWAFDNLKHCFIDFTKVVFKTSSRQIMSSRGPFASLNHHLSHFDKFAFSDAQDEENDFAWPFDTLKHRFIEFTTVIF